MSLAGASRGSSRKPWTCMSRPAWTWLVATTTHCAMYGPALLFPFCNPQHPPPPPCCLDLARGDYNAVRNVLSCPAFFSWIFSPPPLPREGHAAWTWLVATTMHCAMYCPALLGFLKFSLHNPPPPPLLPGPGSWRPQRTAQCTVLPCFCLLEAI